MEPVIPPVLIKPIRNNLPEKASIEAREHKIITDQEIANDELRRENNEWLISGEVLHSLNKELTSSKQELQQTIEKLLVTNKELASRNEELNRSRDYSEAIVTTIREPLIVLDYDLRVKTANRSFYKTFQSTEVDTEGKLFYELQNSQWDIPELRSLLERTLQKELFYESYEVKQKFTSIGERVMILNAR
ncbi:MAG TPA: chemotaxis protein CheR, partial [Cyclobacteriaceae bacterium]